MDVSDGELNIIPTQIADCENISIPDHRSQDQITCPDHNKICATHLVIRNLIHQVCPRSHVGHRHTQELHLQRYGPVGWMDGWMDGWMVGCWMVGWMGGGEGDTAARSLLTNPPTPYPTTKT